MSSVKELTGAGKIWTGIWERRVDRRTNVNQRRPSRRPLGREFQALRSHTHYVRQRGAGRDTVAGQREAGGLDDETPTRTGIADARSTDLTERLVEILDDVLDILQPD